MNEIKYFIGIIAAIVILSAICTIAIRTIFITGADNKQYRETIEKARSQYRELEKRNAELEKELQRLSVEISSGSFRVETAIDVVYDDNRDAIAEIRNLREIQKQIQGRVLNSGGDSGGTGGGGDNLTASNN